MAISTYDVASSSDATVCMSVSMILAVLYLLVFNFSVIQIIRLWAGGSKLSHRKRVFIRFMACALVRSVWYFLSSQNILPENYTEFTYAAVQLPGSLGHANQWISLATWEILSHYAYLWPTAILFTSNSWLVINWFQLYTKEKLRRKMAPGNTPVDATPIQRRKKVERKRSHLYYAHVFFNSVVHATVIYLSIYINGNNPYALGFILNMFSPEAFLSLICIISLLSMVFYACRWLANLRLATSSDSPKLKMHTALLLLLSLTLLVYYMFMVTAHFLGFYELQPDGNGSFQLSIGLVRTHAFLRIFELLHNTLILTILASPSLSLRPPPPGKTKEITQDWLTNVLRENGTIRSTTTVIGFSSVSLYGGCHFKVARVSLTYSVEKPDDPHKTIIVKLLYWDKPLWQRVIVYAKYLMKSLDREAMYLNSYRIESYFYKVMFNSIQGFHLAETYYNQEDVFNNRFGMILQDLSKNEDGQPGGFCAEDARRIMTALAEFHASNFGLPNKQLIGWSNAGYWTGTKREPVKLQIAECWEKAMQNFPEMQLRERWPVLGGLLKDKFKYIQSEFNKMNSRNYRTFCHGDFKISNLFVKKPSQNHPEGKVYVIDWQWFGQGNGTIDAAYFLYTSLRVEDLPLIPELLKFYHTKLVSFPQVTDYPFEVFEHHAKVTLVDFCIYVIASKYAAMTMTDFYLYEQKVKDGLHLRSTNHMEKLLSDTSAVVKEWSKRKKKETTKQT